MGERRLGFVPILVTIRLSKLGFLDHKSSVLYLFIFRSVKSIIREEHGIR